MGIPPGVMGKIGRTFKAPGRSVADISASVRATSAEERVYAGLDRSYSPRTLDKVRTDRSFGNDVHNMHVNNAIDAQRNTKMDAIQQRNAMETRLFNNITESQQAMASSGFKAFAKNENLQARVSKKQNAYNARSVESAHAEANDINKAFRVPNVGAGKSFPIKDTDSPWMGAFKAGSESVLGKLENMNWRTAGKWMGGPMAGAGVGAVTGMLGNIAAPGSIENGGFVQSAFKGAAMGAALGVAHRASSAGLAHVKTLNGLGSRFEAQANMLSSGLNMTKNFTGSKLTMGALTVAGAGMAINTNLTRPINGVM